MQKMEKGNNFGKEKSLLPELPKREPSWSEGSKHSGPRVFIPKPRARGALSHLRAQYPDLFTDIDKYGNGNGQKETKVAEWIETPCGDNGKGCVFVDEKGRFWLIKHPNWWDPKSAEERFEHPGLVPDSAKYPIDVLPRDLSDERNEVEPPLIPEAAGCELEFAVAGFWNNQIVPVDIQEVLEAFKEMGISASIEGWVSQLEHPSKPKHPDLSFSDHRKELVKELFIISKTLESFGVYLVPTAVMPYSGKGQPNLENPHVRNVLTTGLEVALGRGLDLEEAADILADYGVNGLHITVNLKEDENGLVGDERLKRVFELTHSPISILLKALTLSGNLESVEALQSDRLSYRDIHRAKLPTARVGLVKRLFDPEVILAFENGAAPSLERASLCDEEGNIARGVHNPLGRQKQSGRDEFTAFDIEPNIDKTLALECLLSLFTTVVDKAVLEGKEDWLFEGLTEDQKRLFFDFLYKNEEYQRFSELVETYGVKGDLEIDGEIKTVGEVIIDFINFVEGKAREAGLLTDASKEECALLNYLRGLIQKHLQSGAAPDFETYLDPSSEFYGVGTVSEIAKKRFEGLMNSGYNPEQARIQVLKELSQAYNKHLEFLYNIIKHSDEEAANT